MKKELLVAIILGLSLGLIVSYGLYRARKSLQPTNTIEATPNPSPNASPNSSLILFSPNDESIQATKDIKITGTTKPNVLVVIFVNKESHITTADATGNFSIQASLQPNANDILVRAIDEDGQTTEEERTVIFNTTPFDEVPTATYSASPTPSPVTTSRRRRSLASPSPINSVNGI